MKKKKKIKLLFKIHFILVRKFIIFSFLSVLCKSALNITEQNVAAKEIYIN